MPKKRSFSTGQVHQKLVGRVAASVKTRHAKPNTTLFEQIDIYLGKHLNKIFWVTFILTLLFGVLLFDIRFSLAGDDSAYVIRAADFIKHFNYPGYQGPLYPIVLSPFVFLFGIHAIPLKALSLLFILGFIVFTYKAFKNRIPPLLLTALLLLVSVNSFILYFASQTYSEAFFMFLQSLILWLFFTFFIEKEQKKLFREQAFQHLILALCILCLAITRSIGFAAVIAVVLYFLLKGQWKNVVFFIISFILLMAAFQGLKYLFWGNSGIQFSSQAESLISKDYYRPDLGKENFQGYINRLVTNSYLYLYKYLYTLMGIRGNYSNFTFYPFAAISTYAMLIASIVLGFKKNNYLFFTGIYVFIFIVITFLILQTNLAQIRLIIPYFPLLLLMLLAFFYRLSSLKVLKILQVLIPVLILVLFSLTIRTTISNVKVVQKITNRYWGLTPDWENYCKISEWASRNLPQDAVVACRKPSVSFIYGNGKRFFGITTVKSFRVESLLSEWSKNKWHPYLISTASLNQKPISENMYELLSKGMIAFGIKGDLFVKNIQFLVIHVHDSINEKTLEDLKSLDTHLIDNIFSLKSFLKKSNSDFTIIYPDTLLNILMKEKVTHVLEAHLRFYSDRKTSETITTVEGFMDLVSYKYPMLMTKIIQMGEDDNEPAEIYKLDYDKYGLKIPQ
jgi:prepilin signal peptidase PulO-like enzyme (type II secretory pathway)